MRVWKTKDAFTPFEDSCSHGWHGICVWGRTSLYTETFISMEPAAQGPSLRILRLGLPWLSRG